MKTLIELMKAMKGVEDRSIYQQGYADAIKGILEDIGDSEEMQSDSVEEYLRNLLNN